MAEKRNHGRRTTDLLGIKDWSFQGSVCLGSRFSCKSKDIHLREVILVIDLLIQVRMSSSYLLKGCCDYVVIVMTYLRKGIQRINLT